MLLAASSLLRLPQFLQCLKQHPLQKFGTTDEECFKNNRFLGLLKCAAERALINDPIIVLRKWAVLIESDFYRRNYMFAPMQDLQRCLGDQGFVCDTRKMASFMTTSAAVIGSLRQELLQTNIELRRLTEDNVEAKRYRYENEKNVLFLQQQVAMLIQLVQGKRAVLAAPLAVPATAPVTPTNSVGIVALPAPSSVQGLTAKGVFISWQADGYNISTSDPSVGKNVRSSIKICVEYLSLFLKDQIDALPATANCGASAPKWSARLQLQVNHAWRAAEDFAKPDKLSTSLSAFKAFMYARTSDLPEGPTGVSAFQPPDETKHLRTKAELVAEKTKNGSTAEKKMNNKRKSPPTSSQQEEEGNKRTKEKTTGADASVGATPPSA
jgi:hypothetical protein